MLRTIVTRADAPRGEVTTRLLEGRIVETIYSGHVTEALVASVRDATPEILREVPHAGWLLDMTRVKDFDSRARIPGGEILKCFRELGGEQFAAVVPSGTLRMVIRAVAFATGSPIQAFDARTDALSWLREQSRSPGPAPAR